VTAYLSYWNAWPDLDGSRTIAVAISIVSQKGSPSSRELNEMFPAAAYPGIRFRVLPDLKSPQELHARIWLSHPKVKQFYRWDLYRDPLRDRIHEIFRERAAIPMRELAGPLLAALQAYE
jgi:hypothetical protein